MSNWCKNETIFYGDNEKLKSVYDKIGLKILERLKKGESISLSEVTSEFDCPLSIGRITYIELLDDGALSVYYDTAWQPKYHEIDEALKEYAPSIYQVTHSLEPNMAIFVNTDKEKRYFKEEYFMDIDICGPSLYKYEDDDWCGCSGYHKNLDSVIKLIKRHFKLKYIPEDYDGVINLIRELNKDKNIFIHLIKISSE